MKFDSNCKAIIESMNGLELEAYIDFLRGTEIPRHRRDMVMKFEDNQWIREHELMGTVYDRTMIKLNQSAIYRHRLDIKSTRECILRAEDRMDMLEFLS